jgi:hypothetical protein
MRVLWFSVDRIDWLFSSSLRWSHYHDDFDLNFRFLHPILQSRYSIHHKCMLCHFLVLFCKGFVVQNVTAREPTVYECVY